jgi:DNA-binding SARP family transcriptional activator
MTSYLRGGRLVIPADGNLNSDNYLSGDIGQWDNDIELLRVIRDDFQQTRKHLEQVSQRLAEREALVDLCLQRTDLKSPAFQPLCLVEYKIGNPVNQLGRTFLGGTSRPPAMPVSNRLNIRCLGHFDVRTDRGQVKHWRSMKAKSVFQYLLTHPREPAVKEMIMEALWPECSSQAAGNNLKAAVHQIQLTLSSLGGEMQDWRHVLFLQGSYAINPGTHLWIDVEEFEKHWTAGRRFEKEHHLAEAMSEYEKAETLYQGDFLEEELYEEWTMLRRETLRDIYLAVLSKLAGHAILINDLENCIHYSQILLGQDPCREDAYRWLMYCYTNLGHRNRALRWYEICCRIIRSEMDTVPDRRTTELYYRILKDEEIEAEDGILSHLKKLIKWDY